MRWTWAGLACGCLAATLGAASVAPGEAPQGVYTPPRVVVAVYSAGGPVDRAMLLFDAEMPRGEVEKRLTRLGELCGSKVWDLEIAYRPWESLGQAPGSKPVIQTLVWFGMEGLTDWKRGRLAVAPFAEAFRVELPLRVVYKVGAEFPFQGPAGAEFAVDGARVRHFPSATSHMYDLTAAPPPSAGPAAASAGRAARRWSAVLTGLTVAIAITLLALVAVVVWAARTHRPAAAGAEGSDMEESKGERADPGRSKSQGDSEAQRG